MTFLGLYQGAVPLVVRGLFGRDQRFAPAMWLSSPGWWIACLAIVAVTVALLVVLDNARTRRFPTAAAAPMTPPNGQNTKPEHRARNGDGTGGYDALSGAVFLIGIYNGVAPFVARLVFDGNLLLAFPLRLSAPWWWMTSIGVIVATLIVLVLIDNAKEQGHTDD